MTSRKPRPDEAHPPLREPSEEPSEEQSQEPPDEREIIADVQFVVDGGRDGSLRKVAYALYVAALLLLTYGVTTAQAFFATQDPQWLRAQVLSWRGAAVLAVSVGIALAVAWRSGRIRGPVVPPLPWIDLVVSGPVDRALTLRRWWLMALALVVTGAAMVGAVIGGGAWIARVGGPAWLLVATLSSTALGGVLLVVWLAGQVSVSAPVACAFRPRAALRSLRLEDLRIQSARATRMGGSVLLGDLRALRLETAAPITRARGRRLRPSRPWNIVLRRDLLGLRRQPGSGVIAALVSGLGAAGLTWSCTQPAVPVIVAIVSGLLLHIGFSTAAEGLRMQGDNAGTPPLLGLSFRAEALGHLAVPMIVSGGSALLVAAAAAWTVGLPVAVAWVAVMVVVVTGTTMAAAFRGSAPITAFVPGAGPAALLFWMSRQAVTAAATGGALVRLSRLDGAMPSVAAALMAVGALVWGFSRLKAVTLEHRI